MKKNKEIFNIIRKYESVISKNDFSNIESLLANESLSDSNYVLFTDGACEFDEDNKPINAGIGGIVKFENEIIFSFSENIGLKTNNEAEYMALIRALRFCIDTKIKYIEVFLDSELVVKQINGQYKVKNDRMIKLHSEVKKLLNKFLEWNVHHILRHNNTEADKLSKEGLLKKNNV
jgi:ribonuclease HI